MRSFTCLNADSVRAMRASSLGFIPPRQRASVEFGCADNLVPMQQAVWPEAVERVAAFLRNGGVEARIEEFEAGTPTAADAARAVGCKLEQIVKSLVFDCDGRPFVVLVPGDRKADA